MTAIEAGRRAATSDEERALLDAVHELASRLGANTETVACELRELVERQQRFQVLRESFDQRC